MAFSKYAARGGAGVFIPEQIIYNKSHLPMGGEHILGVTWWGWIWFCLSCRAERQQRLRLAQVLLWALCPWSLIVFMLPFPSHCQAPGSNHCHGNGHFCSKRAQGIFGSSSALQAALGGSGLSRNLCCPMSDAQFSGTFLASQAFWCWCCSPAKSIRVSCTSVGLDPGDGLCRWAALFPPFLLFSARHACSCSAALQAEAAVIFQHVLNRGVVGPTRQLRSLFHVFTCLGKVHPCFVGSLWVAQTV